MNKNLRMKKRKCELKRIDKIFIISFLINLFISCGIAGCIDLHVSIPVYGIVIWIITAIIVLGRIAIFDIFEI